MTTSTPHPSRPASARVPRPSLALLDALLRHPLATLLLGFLLTGVVGTGLSNHLATLRQREADAAHLRDTRREAIRSLSRATAERVARMQLLIRLIQQRRPPEILAQARSLYEEAEARWSVNRNEYFLLAREILGQPDFERFRSEFDARLARNRVAPLKAAIDLACQAAESGGDGAPALAQARADILLREFAAGAEVLVDALYDLSGIAALDPANPRAARVRDDFSKRIEAACP